MTDPKVHFDTRVTINLLDGTLSLCQRYVLKQFTTRDPAAVTCQGCRVRMNPRNGYWIESRPKEVPDGV